MKQRDANDIAREEGIESLRGTLDEAHPFEKGKRASGNGHDGATTPSLLTLPEFLAQFVPPHYLVDGVLQHHCLYSLTGKTGAGKTNVAVLLAALVADPVAGQKFGSHDVEPGRVLYIPAENKTDVQMRAIGLVHRMNLDPARLNLLVTGDATKLVRGFDAEIKRIEDEIKGFGDLSLVIVDTAPALFPGDEENNNVQMRDHGKRLRRLTELPGKPCCLALCHPVKNAASPESLLPRGGGAFIAEMDGNLSLWGRDDKLADLHWCGKFRGPDFDKITFRHETVMTMDLIDHKGRILPTVVARVVTEAEAEDDEARAASQEEQLLKAMLDRPGRSLADLATDCRWFLKGDGRRPYKSLVQRVMKRLIKDKLAAKEGRNFALTKVGKAAATKVADTQKGDDEQ